MIPTIITATIALLIGVPIGYLIGRMALVTVRNKNRERWLASVTQDYPIQEIFTDKQGNKWYTFARVSDALKMPQKRAVLAEVSTKYAEMNMTKDDLERFIAAIQEECNKGKLTKAFYFLELMKERLTWAAEEETLLDLACVYFLLEGENVLACTPEMTAKKKAILREDAEARAFFLVTAYNCTAHYGSISETGILDYLTKKRNEREIHLKNLSASVSQSSSTN